jgi:plastocyanin
MKTLFIFIAVACAGFQARAGTIVGSVHAEGKAELGDGARGGGKYDSRKYKFVERVNYAELQDFVVYIEGKVTNAPPYRARTFQIVTQRDAVFRPHVLPLVVGSTVEWPNKDDIFHNVFSMSESNPFDLGLYKDPEVKKVEFKNPGRVDVFCSIHSKMSCVLLVLENPFFSATDTAGHYKIENVPPGNYRVRAWHERLPAHTQEVTVPENGELRVDFVLGIKGLPQY